MVEAVEVFSNGWIEHLKSPDPESDDILGLPDVYESLEEQKAVHRWIGISWVFARPVEFKEMTALMARGCYADLESNMEEELPIPILVIGTQIILSLHLLRNADQMLLEIITTQRKKSISEAFKYLEQTLKKYQGTVQICPRSHG